MPDPIEILLALMIGGVAAVVIVLAFAWPWRMPNPKRAALGWILAIAVCVASAAWFMSVRPDLSLSQDRDRFLLIVLPLFVIVESAIALSGSLSWWTWLLRWTVAGAAARVLLHGTVYFEDPPIGLSTQKWTIYEASAILGGIGLCICELQFAVAALQRRTVGYSVAIALALTCAAAGATTMLSGYESGGKIGLAIGAALIAAVTASFLIRGTPSSEGALGVATGCLGCVLIVGRFFGALSAPHAMILFVAPLLAWRTEFAPFDSLRPWLRGVVRVVLVGLPLCWPLWQASEWVRNPQPAPAVEADPGDIYK